MFTYDYSTTSCRMNFHAVEFKVDFYQARILLNAPT